MYNLFVKNTYHSIFVVYASITLHSVATKAFKRHSLDPVPKFYSNYLIVGISANEISRIKIQGT